VAECGAQLGFAVQFPRATRSVDLLRQNYRRSIDSLL
jgi:hypothetical protein